MYGRKAAAGRGREKWNASRAVKVVSLANETNIRADRVDKRRAGCTRGCREKGRNGGGCFARPAFKLTEEFRFLYNRFNLILALNRSDEDVSRERISISEGYPIFRGYRLPAIIPLLFLAPSSCVPSLVFLLPPYPFSSRSSPRSLLVRITAREVFLDTVKSATRQELMGISVPIKIV